MGAESTQRPDPNFVSALASCRVNTSAAGVVVESKLPSTKGGQEDVEDGVSLPHALVGDFFSNKITH